MWHKNKTRLLLHNGIKNKDTVKKIWNLTSRSLRGGNYHEQVHNLLACINLRTVLAAHTHLKAISALLNNVSSILVNSASTNCFFFRICTTSRITQLGKNGLWKAHCAIKCRCVRSLRWENENIKGDYKLILLLAHKLGRWTLIQFSDEIVVQRNEVRKTDRIPKSPNLIYAYIYTYIFLIPNFPRNHG